MFEPKFLGVEVKQAMGYGGEISRNVREAFHIPSLTHRRIRLASVDR